MADPFRPVAPSDSERETPQERSRAGWKFRIPSRFRDLIWTPEENPPEAKRNRLPTIRRRSMLDVILRRKANDSGMVLTEMNDSIFISVRTELPEIRKGTHDDDQAILEFLATRKRLYSRLPIDTEHIARAKTAFKKAKRKDGRICTAAGLVAAFRGCGVNVSLAHAESALVSVGDHGYLDIVQFVCLFIVAIASLESGEEDGEGAGHRASTTAESVASPASPTAWSDNNLMAKFYGRTNSTIEAQKAKRTVLERAVVDRQGPLRSGWDCIIIPITLTVLLLVPIQVAFTDELGFGFWFYFSLITDVMFMIDVALNCITNYTDHDGVVINDPKLTFRKYLKGAFVWDFLTSLPIDLVLRFVSMQGSYLDKDPSPIRLVRAIKLSRITRAVALIKVARLPKVFEIFRAYEDQIKLSSSMIRIFQLVFMMCMFAHWNACITWMVADAHDFPEDSWIRNAGLVDESIGVQYSWSLFTVLSHMLCIGYGIEPPHYFWEMWSTTVSMVIGASFFAMFIGNLSTLMLNLDAGGAMFSQKKEMFEDYMKYRRLPKELKTRVREYFSFRWRHRQLFDEGAMLGELSHSLRTDITLHMTKGLVQQVPFFQNADEGFLASVVSCLILQTYLPMDLVCIKGEIASSMFFIRTGEVEIVVPPDKVVTTLAEGSYFGEMALLSGSKRGAHVRAKTNCDLYVLEAKDFHRLMKEYPDSDMAKAMVAVAEQRAKTTAVAAAAAEKTSDKAPSTDNGGDSKAEGGPGPTAQATAADKSSNQAHGVDGSVDPKAGGGSGSIGVLPQTPTPSTESPTPQSEGKGSPKQSAFPALPGTPAIGHSGYSDAEEEDDVGMQSVKRGGEDRSLTLLDKLGRLDKYVDKKRTKMQMSIVSEDGSSAQPNGDVR